MSTAQGAFDGSQGARAFGPGDWASWRGQSCGVGRWSAFEIAAMVLGFMVFWPIGLAILGFKYWQRKSGSQLDLQTVAASRWQEARSAMKSQGWGQGWAAPRGFGFTPRATGNTAFDDWRSAEIAKLDEERRKLEEAHREFSEFVSNIRKAKDREEFERFMGERGARKDGGAS